MTLMKWDPFRDLWSLERRFGEAQESIESWVPAVDVFEKGDDLVIRAELAGVTREEIEIRVENNTLLLRGERKQQSEAEQGKTYRRERNYGAFTRRFRLPESVDASGITATHKDGVLELVLPKSAQAKPRRIEVAA